MTKRHNYGTGNNLGIIGMCLSLNFFKWIVLIILLLAIPWWVYATIVTGIVTWWLAKQLPSEKKK